MRQCALLITVGLFFVLLLSASDCQLDPTIFDGGLPDKVSYDAAVPPDDLYEWSISATFDDSPMGGSPLAFAAGPGGRLAILYFKDTNPPLVETCTTNLGEAEITQMNIWLARYDGTDWNHEVMTTVMSANYSLAARYSADSTLHTIYMAGPTTGTYCGASQLVYRQVTDSSMGSETVLAANSVTANECRLMQNACNAGDNVGRSSSLTFLPDGRPLLAFQDNHYLFGQQTDIEGSDLEIVVGSSLSAGGRRCLDDSSGAGYHNVAFEGPGGLGAVATWLIQTHPFDSAGCVDGAPAGSYTWVRGIRLYQEESAGGTWKNVHIADVDVSQTLAAAYTEADGFVIAYSYAGKLAAYTSATGEQFVHQIIDQRGRNGVSPVARVDGEGRIIIAYGRCADSPGSDCRANQDGVQLAALVNGRWLTEKVVNDTDSVDHTRVFLDIDPDTGLPVIAYLNATANRMMVARGTPVDVEE